MNAFEEDFKAERHDRERAHGKFADREKEWMEQLENLTQERDRLTGNMLTLKDQLVAGKREVQYNTLFDSIQCTVYRQTLVGHNDVSKYVCTCIHTVHTWMISSVI